MQLDVHYKVLSDGLLRKQIDGIWTEQECPISNRKDIAKYCGNHCPFFDIREKTLVLGCTGSSHKITLD